MNDERASPPPAAASAPEVRAYHPQALLRMATERAPEDAPAIVAALGAGTRAVLETTAPMDWIAMEADLEVSEAVLARLGPAVFASLVEGRQIEEMKSSVFAGFVQTALRTFAASPATIVKRLPAGWGRLFRNVGWISILSTGRNDAVVRLNRQPAICIASAAWTAGVRAGLQGLYEVVGAKGTVECRVEDPVEGTTLCTFRWK